jgi:hypothetical protein
VTPQPVQIHGTSCVLRTGGDDLNPYVIVRRDSGAVITQQPTRFLAVARAAEVLRNPGEHHADAGRT